MSCDSYNAAHVHVGTDIEMDFSDMYSIYLNYFLLYTRWCNVYLLSVCVKVLLPNDNIFIFTV